MYLNYAFTHHGWQKLQELSNPDFIEVLSEIQRRALFPHW